jgi:hypothetical protein
MAIEEYTLGECARQSETREHATRAGIDLLQGFVDINFYGGYPVRVDTSPNADTTFIIPEGVRRGTEFRHRIEFKREIGYPMAMTPDEVRFSIGELKYRILFSDPDVASLEDLDAARA